jgi:hypothetical protein
MFKLGSFAEYGLLWDTRNQLNNVQSLMQEKLFPKVAACEVKRYGVSGKWVFIAVFQFSVFEDINFNHVLQCCFLQPIVVAKRLTTSYLLFRYH